MPPDAFVETKKKKNKIVPFLLNTGTIKIHVNLCVAMASV